MLFSDGGLEDFLSARDDSNIRGLMLAKHWGDKGPGKAAKKDDDRRIVGVVDLGEEYVHTPKGP